MAPKQISTVGLRLFGIWELLRLIDYAIEAYDMKARFYVSSTMTVGAAYIHMSAYALVTMVCLFSAPNIASYFYPTVPVEGNIQSTS